MNKVVVDTSVIIKWFSSEEESEKAQDLLRPITASRTELILPHFAQLEISNILRLGKKFLQVKTDKCIVDFFDLLPRFVEIDKDYSLEISSLAYNHNLASYDAAFVAVANRWNIPLFTADYKHHQKSISKNIVWLKEWQGKL